MRISLRDLPAVASVGPSFRALAARVCGYRVSTKKLPIHHDFPRAGLHSDAESPGIHFVRTGGSLAVCPEEGARNGN